MFLSSSDEDFVLGEWQDCTLPVFLEGQLDHWWEHDSSKVLNIV